MHAHGGQERAASDDTEGLARSAIRGFREALLQGAAALKEVWQACHFEDQHLERQYKAAKTEVTTFLDGTKDDRDLQKQVEQTARFALLSPAERLASYGNYGAAMAALPPAVRGHPQTK